MKSPFRSDLALSYHTIGNNHTAKEYVYFTNFPEVFYIFVKELKNLPSVLKFYTLK